MLACPIEGNDKWRSPGKLPTLCVTDLPSNLPEMKDAEVKSKLPTSLGKKITKKAPAGESFLLSLSLYVLHMVV